MQFGEAISDGFSKYAIFSGRSSRSAYWWWTLFYVLVRHRGVDRRRSHQDPSLRRPRRLAFFLPNLAVLVRRLHDADHSGWWVLIGFVPSLAPSS